MIKNKFLKKHFKKSLLFISLLIITLSTALINVRASGISYEEDDTIFNFTLNRNYLDFIAENFPDDFSYYFVLPITFEIGNSSQESYNLSVRITNGAVVEMWYEGFTNLGMPVDYYLVENGSWTNNVDVDVAFAEGINISETYINDLYNFNFQYDDDRSYDNYINRFYQYIAINNLLFIRLNTYRFNTNLSEIFDDYTNILYNISQVYIEESEDSYGVIGFSIGRTILDTDGIPLDVPMQKISFMSNNEKYNELNLYRDENNGYINELGLRYNNFEPYTYGETNPWINDNYKFLTLYNEIGIMDYLNLSIYGDFNVSQFWVDPDTNATFNDLFTGIANVPIVVLSNLLSFSIFGWTAFSVLTGIITLLIILWLIRKLTR